MPESGRSVLEKSPCFPDLRGQVALVTGGGTGIGRGIARRLAAEGMRVAICGRRREPLDETIALIQAAGGEATSQTADVGEPDDLQRLLGHIAARFGAVDALVHNAMLMDFSPFGKSTLEVWEESFATGCRAAYVLCERLVPGMRERGRGGIVFVSSVLAQRSGRFGPAYHAVKGALEALTRHMAIVLAPDGVRVNALAPGLIHARGDSTRRPPANEHIPLGRAGTPAEMAAAVAFLLSDQSSYITGHVLHADGGTTVQLSPPSIRL